VAPERISKWDTGVPVRSESGEGGTATRREAPEKKLSPCTVPLHFLALKAQLVVLVSAFVMVSIQFGQFLVCCYSTHGAPRAQPFVKVGGTCPPCPMESAPLVRKRNYENSHVVGDRV